MKFILDLFGKIMRLANTLMELSEKQIEQLVCTYPGCQKAFHLQKSGKMLWCDDQKHAGWPLLAKCFFCGTEFVGNGESDLCRCCGTSIPETKTNVALLFFTIEFFPEKQSSLNKLALSRFVNERMKEKARYFPMLGHKDIGSHSKNFVSPGFLERIERESIQTATFSETTLEGHLTTYLKKVGKLS